MTDQKTYEDGLRDGQIAALEKMMGEHKERLDGHGRRLRTLERVAWIVLGIVATLEALPNAQRILEILGG